MRIFIYSRKSVYTGKGESIENQVEMCRQYIVSRIDGGGEAKVSVYEDEGFSGKTLCRPQFQKMLADAKRDRPDYIVCYRLDRISRSVGDFAPLVEELIARGIGFVCIKEQFDTSTPMGKAMMYIASVFAQLERETIAERVRDNMFLLARTGRWLGGTPPTGFASEKVAEVVVDGRKRTSCRLKPNPAEIGTVKAIYQAYWELQSLNGVSKRLLQEEVRGRNGKPYTLPGIKDILRNPVYCTADREAYAYFKRLGADLGFPPEQCSDRYGLLAYNRRDHAQKGHPRTDPSQWVVAVGKHPGIVRGADWVRTQALLAQRSPGKSERQPQSYNDYSLLSGLLFCSQCGGRMFAKRRSSNRELFDYICAGKLQGGGSCTCQNLAGKQADRLVLDWLMEHIQGDGGVCQLMAEQRSRLASQVPVCPIGQLDLTIQRKQQEIASLVAALAAGESEPVARHVSARIEELDLELSRLGEKKARVEKAAGGGSQVQLLSEELGDWKRCFSSLTIQEKRAFLRLFVEKLEWDGRELHLYLYKREETKWER